MLEEGWSWQTFMNVHSHSGKWLGHPSLSSIPAAATVPEHKYEQQQGSVHCILLLAGRRDTTVEIRDFCANSGEFQLGNKCRL